MSLGFGLIASAVIGAIGSRSAARTQERGAREAREASEGMTAPFREAGAAVLPSLTDLALAGPETELTRTEGFRGIQNSAAAGGRLHSGGTLGELTRFNFMLNESAFNTRYNALLGLASLGSNAATGQASNTSNLITGGANARAAGTAGVANAGQAAIGNFAFLPFYQNALANLNRGG